MDDANQGMEASAATIRDRIRRQNAVTLNHQQAIYTEKLRPSADPALQFLPQYLVPFNRLLRELSAITLDTVGEFQNLPYQQLGD